SQDPRAFHYRIPFHCLFPSLNKVRTQRESLPTMMMMVRVMVSLMVCVVAAVGMRVVAAVVRGVVAVVRIMAVVGVMRLLVMVMDAMVRVVRRVVAVSNPASNLGVDVVMHMVVAVMMPGDGVHRAAGRAVVRMRATDVVGPAETGP